MSSAIPNGNARDPKRSGRHSNESRSKEELANKPVDKQSDGRGLSVVVRTSGERRCTDPVTKKRNWKADSEQRIETEDEEIDLSSGSSGEFSLREVRAFARLTSLLSSAAGDLTALVADSLKRVEQAKSAFLEVHERVAGARERGASQLINVARPDFLMSCGDRNLNSSRGKPRGRHPSKKLHPKQLYNLPPGRHADGEGLYLVVRVLGDGCTIVRHWVQRLVIKQRRRDLGLGPLDYVSLPEARAKAHDNRRVARAGGNPKVPSTKAPIFRVVYEAVKKIRGANWEGGKIPASWGADFDKYILPVIGDLPIDEITVQQLVDIILPYWKGRNTKGPILRQNLAAIFQYAVVSRFRPDNPAADLLILLPKVRRTVKHQASLPYAQAPAMITEWQALPVEPIYKFLLIFIVVTASRFGQAAKATWSEFDLSKGKWRVPSEHMKARHVHEVPLPRQLVELLNALRASEVSDHSLVFPRPARPALELIDPAALLRRVRKLKKTDADGRPIATHGFRATFRVWTIQQARASREVCEDALAHSESDKTVVAYTANADTYDDRVELMQQWADFLLGEGWKPRE